MESIELLHSFKIAETDSFEQKAGSKTFKRYYEKINGYVYPQLSLNPFFGLNIKKLKGEFEGIYRYRVGKIRIFYSIDIENKMIFILNIDFRKDIYEK
jgi:mRNA interferase RelE/StbE